MTTTAQTAEARHLLQVYGQLPLEATSAEGVYLHAGQRRIIDFYGGHAVAALGYAHPDLLATLQAQAKTMYFQSNAVALEVRAQAADALADFAPAGLQRVFDRHSMGILVFGDGPMWHMLFTDREPRNWRDIVATDLAKLGAFEVWILTLKANNNEVTYQKIRLTVRKDKPVPLKEEDYSVSDRLMRTTLFLPTYVQAAGKLIPAKIKMIDEINKGQQSVLTISDVNVGKLPDTVFVKTFLERAQ
jgi:glutamate-1-semialdehyde aminotransferase